MSWMSLLTTLVIKVVCRNVALGIESDMNRQESLNLSGVMGRIGVRSWLLGVVKKYSLII